tara:strand:+ start:4231 stop:4392 length:162 start_codon:yes stop_codon:yes gene_type:complete
VEYDSDPIAPKDFLDKKVKELSSFEQDEITKDLMDQRDLEQQLSSDEKYQDYL